MINSLFQRFLHKLAFNLPGGYHVRPVLHRLRGARIGNKVWISQYVYIDELHPDAVEIGDNSSIGLRTSIFTHFYWGPRLSLAHAGKVSIGKNVFVGPHCVVLPKVSIGDGAVVQAGTVVSRDIPPGVMWGAPKAEPLAAATVPLTPDTSYDLFIKGLRPLRVKQGRNCTDKKGGSGG
jgi:acetyltransferase-like isoleucine patch superfamily enzyme